MTAKSCFFLSPIGEEDSPERATADKVLRHLVRKALAPDFDVQRADDAKNPGAITPQIVSSILAADLVVADITGLNPNVFYEVAIAHGFRRPTVHIQRASERPPFDVKDMRIVRYDIADPDVLEGAQKRLREYADFAVANPDKVETPLSSAERFLSVHASGDPIAESNVQVMDAVNALRTEVRRALSRPSRGSAQAMLRLTESTAEADFVSLSIIVGRIVEDGRARPEDFEDVVTTHTSGRFDEWARETLKALVDDPDTAEVDAVLLAPDMLE